jgi:isopentenyl phosphate kinase
MLPYTQIVPLVYNDDVSDDQITIISADQNVLSPFQFQSLLVHLRPSSRRN